MSDEYRTEGVEPGSSRQLGAISLLLVAILALSSLGEGGGEAGALAAWHGALAVLAALVLTMDARLRDEPRGLPALVLFPLATFVLFFGAGAVRAPYGYAALLVSLELTCCLAVAWLAARIGWRFVRIARWPLLTVASLHGLNACYQWVVRDGVRRPASTFLNPNHLSLWVVAVLLLFFGGAFGKRDIRKSAAFLPLSVLACAAFALAGSRGGFLALAAGAGWLLWSRRESFGRGWRIGAGVTALALISLFLWTQVRRLEHTDPFRYQRLRIWKASLGAIVADPWWGSGPGQFAGAAASLGFPDHDGPLRFDRKFSGTHSDLLRVPCEFGLPAALAVLAGVVLAARRVRRRRQARSLPPESDGAIAALMAMAAHALVDNPSQWPAVYLLGSALFGVLFSEPLAASVVSRRPVRGLALAALVLFAFVVADLGPYLAWREVRGLPRGRLDATDQARLARALKLNPIHPDGWLRRAEHLAGDGTDWDLDRYAEARECAEHAVRLAPADARYEVGLARVEARASTTILASASTRDRAVLHFLRAESLARHDPFVPLLRAALLIDTGEPGAALRAAERSLAIEPEAVLPRLVLADALFETGDAERAVAILSDARERAERYSGLRGPSYEADLLRPAPALFSRLERKIGAAPSGIPAGGRSIETP